MQYRVGGLLYTPAIHSGIADKIANKAYPCLTSMAFCLEDSIQDSALAEAEESLKATLRDIREKIDPHETRPLLFVRIRTPEHMKHMHEMLAGEEDNLAGYILPKFDTTNAARYLELLREINRGRRNELFIMPILESQMIANVQSRRASLIEIKNILDEDSDHVLNIRVGGNDFSNLYGLRRSVHQNIYEIGVIRDILVDIVNIFASEYVVSGPVWEYFGQNRDEPWAIGLNKELELDRLNGFIGKTAIHPSQLPLIFNSLKVSKTDFKDAKDLIGWSEDSFAVAKSTDGSRMNEVKCHSRWAERILALGSIYGFLEE